MRCRESRSTSPARAAIASARSSFPSARRLARSAVFDHEPRDGAIVDCLEQAVGVLRHDHLLVRRPDVESPVVSEWPPGVEQEVVGVDEEIGPAGALNVVEGGDRRCDERARADSPAGPGQHDAQPVLLPEPLEQLLESGRDAVDLDLEGRAAELARRVHACDISVPGQPRPEQIPVADESGAASSLPATARAVVIGAGIVGNSLLGHLAHLGWKDLVLIDKGPLPNPGGSTGHASNFIFPVDHSREMTDLTADSLRQFEELGVLTVCGGIEVARTEERMEELRRRMASAKSWGIDDVALVTPAEVKQLVPFVDESVIIGGFYSKGVGVVDSLRMGTLMREQDQETGAAKAYANTEVLGIDVENGRVKRVRTDRGDVEAEYVVIACGVWSPRIARMAGAAIPLTPAVHQMIDVGPVPRFADARTAIDFPIVRDMDTNMYERQDGGGLEVGSYAHRPILHDPEEIPSIEESALTPTELPFTQDDFVQQMEHALELMPEILGDESVGIKYAINGLLSLTPDGLPILGETPEVKGLWSAAAVWVKEGPGVGRALAEWMVEGEPEIDLQASDIARFHP